MRNLYVTDLDGTLLNKDAVVSPYTCEVINRLVEKGLLFTYATARSLTSALTATAGLMVRTPVAAYNGAFIIRPDTEEVLHFSGFAPQTADWIRGAAGELGIFPLVYSVIGGEQRVSWDVTGENEGMRNYLSRRRGDKRLRPMKGQDGLYDGEIFYFTCIGGREELIPLYERVKENERCVCHFQKELYQPEYWCEIMPYQATKAQAVQRLKKMLGCTRVVAFGDSYNDIPLFQIADECYAVVNAVDELKAVATGIIESNERDGVAKWLQSRAEVTQEKLLRSGRYNLYNL